MHVSRTTKGKTATVSVVVEEIGEESCFFVEIGKRVPAISAQMSRGVYLSTLSYSVSSNTTRSIYQQKSDGNIYQRELQDRPCQCR